MPTGEVIAVSRATQDAEESRTQAGGDEVLAKQVYLLYDNALLTQCVALINSAILAFVQWSQVEHVAVTVWLVLAACGAWQVGESLPLRGLFVGCLAVAAVALAFAGTGRSKKGSLTERL